MKLEFVVITLIAAIIVPSDCRYLRKPTPPTQWEDSWSNDLADDTLAGAYDTPEDSIYDSDVMAKPKRAFSFWVKGSPATWNTKYSNKKDEFPRDQSGPRPYGLPLRWGR